MSGLVDIWTSKVAKLREKGRTIWSSGLSPTNIEGSSRVANSSPALIRGMRVGSPALVYSEASLSMLMDCFSA
ncbi:hypothetical protein NC653_023400 [Populus alba x Populus x berolinensis]|uniref:Uncharacterized protein n=1 Tax=Populus alba x Populus x berolinensis TaxID=444605 RepID=A0AAD6QCV9_9ROSI|nr:hypothetical protein NC653_023400 [Populus alba x Populus x berolinensis]